MELIERYVAAIRRNLPAAKADDIAAEIRDDLMTRVEAREDRLGRPLARDEAEALVKEFGHPLVVAGRYRQNQQLIGPEIFPFYAFALRIALLAVGAIIVVVGAAEALFGARDPIQAGLNTADSLVSWGLFAFAATTLFFALVERTGFATDHVHSWTPAELPDVRDKQPGHWESALEVALGVAFLLWWTGVIAIPDFAGNTDFRIEPAPIFAELYWPILALAAARLVHNLIQWLRPRWKLVRGLIGAATGLGGLTLLVLVYRAGEWATVVATGMPPAEAAGLQDSLNLALGIAIFATAVIWTLNCLGDLVRLVRGGDPLKP